MTSPISDGGTKQERSKESAKRLLQLWCSTLIGRSIKFHFVFFRSFGTIDDVTIAAASGAGGGADGGRRARLLRRPDRLRRLLALWRLSLLGLRLVRRSGPWLGPREFGNQTEERRGVEKRNQTEKRRRSGKTGNIRKRKGGNRTLQSHSKVGERLGGGIGYEKSGRGGVAHFGSAVRMST